MGEYDEWFIGHEYRDKENLKTETDIGQKKSDILFLKKRKVGLHHKHLIVKERDMQGDFLIWGHNTQGIWGTNKWIDEPTTSWITTRVINPNREYMDNLYGDLFKDTSSTATWDTSSGCIIFDTSSQTAISKVIYVNNETISSATLTPTLITGSSSSYGLFLSADSGSNWENVESGSSHTFINQGEYLKWKITGSNLTVSSIKIEY